MNQKRIILKLSGESFAAGNDKFNIAVIEKYGKQIKQLKNQGYEIGIVVGGGNLWRGIISKEIGIDRSSSDYIGMMATVMNGLVLQQVLENKFALDTRTMTAININKVSEPFIRRKAIRHLEKGKIVIFVGGTGSPYFTTDTCAALRASEVGASTILMAKNGVDGVYDKDPNKYSDAIRFDELTYNEVFEKDIKIMDKTAIAMCAENNTSLLIFSANEENCILKALKNEINSTKVINK